MANTFFLIAFGFGNLAMLGWLAAAAAPLLIHLWSRRRFRETRWAAMQFLLAAMRKNARRMQLQQWLLLAVRTAIVALVVLAVAQPYGERLVAGGATAPTHKVLVIDGSYSMAYHDGEATNFARAKQRAAALVRDSRPADTFTVILMARPARTIVGREVVERRAVAAEIEALTQTHTAADLAGTLVLVHEALAADTPARRAADRQEVYFFTDLQRSTWPESETSTESGEQSAIRNPQSAITTLAQHAALAVIDLGQPRAENLAVTSLTTPDTFVTVGRPTTFVVTLRQFGLQPRTEFIVELLIDGVAVAEQTVDVVAAATDATVRFTHRFSSPGDHTVAVRAADDNLNIDNHRWLVVPVRDEVHVLCVAGRDGAADYVADALNPNPDGNSPIRPTIVSEGDLADVELFDFDCIFMCNVARLTAGEAERLARYTAAGGGVVFFLGDQVVPESYNALGHGEQPLLPARLSELVTQPQFGLDPLDYRHPIVAPFRGRERAGLVTTPVGRYYRLEVSEGRPDVEVAAAVSTGDPLIVAAPLGRGRTVLVATDGSLASVDAATGEPWTHWPTWPSFLPIVRELLAYAAAGQQQHMQQLVGTPLASRPVVAGPPTEPSVRGRETRAQPALEILRPDGRTAAVSAQSSPAGWEWSYSDTDLSGIYSLRGLPHGGPQPFAVNVDTAESDLAKLDPQQLPAELLVRDTWQQPADDAAAPRLAQAGWHLPLLWAVLGLLFVESFLAWRFGRGGV